MAVATARVPPISVTAATTLVSTIPLAAATLVPTIPLAAAACLAAYVNLAANAKLASTNLDTDSNLAGAAVGVSTLAVALAAAAVPRDGDCAPAERRAGE